MLCSYSLLLRLTESPEQRRHQPHNQNRLDKLNHFLKSFAAGQFIKWFSPPVVYGTLLPFMCRTHKIDALHPLHSPTIPTAATSRFSAIRTASRHSELGP